MPTVAQSKLTAEQRSQRARLAAYARWAKEDPAANAARGQAGLLARFEREVDPNSELPEAERLRRAECARKAHMQRIAIKSADKRRAERAELERLRAELAARRDSDAATERNRERVTE